jgi:hypothetical protein
MIETTPIGVARGPQPARRRPLAGSVQLQLILQVEGPERL